MKRFLKRIVVSILARQVHRLRQKHQFKIIGVVGGIGKTSTKQAIAKTLSKTLRVRYEELRVGYQESNYNHLVSVPLVIFGHRMPSLFNPFAWIKLFINNAQQIRGTYPFDVVVELGTNKPGEIAAFQQYLQLDYTIVTAIVPEHMEYFTDMQAVANEELSVVKYSEKILYNADLVAEEFRQPLQAAISYGSKQPADYTLANVLHRAGQFECDVRHNGQTLLHFQHAAVSETQLYSVLAAVVIGNDLGLEPAQLLAGIATITPVNGRLHRLRGINNSLIIDDTYNALPDAVKAGLEVLYTLQAPQKIAILGNMNELGTMSAQAHTEIGELCSPDQLDLVVTIGPDANSYLAAAAEAKGCIVKRFDTPYDAGNYLLPKIQQDAIIYAKGSQNKVFAEEAIKPLLADPNDQSMLVRQSSYWLKRKQKSFSLGA